MAIIIRVKHYWLALVSQMTANCILLEEIHVGLRPSRVLISLMFYIFLSLYLRHKRIVLSVWALVRYRVVEFFLIQGIFMSDCMFLFQNLPHLNMIPFSMLLFRIIRNCSSSRGGSWATWGTSWMLNLDNFFEVRVETWEHDIAFPYFDIHLVINQTFDQRLEVKILLPYFLRWILW